MDGRSSENILTCVYLVFNTLFLRTIHMHTKITNLEELNKDKGHLKKNNSETLWD